MRQGRRLQVDRCLRKVVLTKQKRRLGRAHWKEAITGTFIHFTTTKLSIHGLYTFPCYFVSVSLAEKSCKSNYQSLTSRWFGHLLLMLCSELVVMVVWEASWLCEALFLYIPLPL